MPGTPFLGVKAVPWRSLGLAFALFDPFFLHRPWSWDVKRQPFPGEAGMNILINKSSHY